jgi:hypothetical protein
VIPILPELVKDDPSLFGCTYLATLAWTGKKKPPKELLAKAADIFKNSFTGNVAVLIRNSDGVATSGIIETPQSFGKNYKFWFDRSDTFLMNVSLANVDLSKIFNNYNNLMFHTNFEPVATEVKLTFNQCHLFFKLSTRGKLLKKYNPKAVFYFLS